MRFLKQGLAVLVLAVGLSLIALSAIASPTNPQEGVDYRMLPQAQPTDSGNKVEVTEFFWYSCPHWAAFEPSLST